MRREILFGVVLAALLAPIALGTPVTIKVVRDGVSLSVPVEVWNATPRLGGKILDRDKLVARGVAPLNATLEEGESYIVYAFVNGTTYEFHLYDFKAPSNGVVELNIAGTYWRSSMKLVLVLAGALVFLLLLVMVRK